MAENKIKILLVDDNEMIRIFFRDVFWLHGLDDKFQLEMVDGPEAAIKEIEDDTKRPDIVFLDMNMPMNIDGRIISTPQAGLSVLKHIKINEKFKNIKVFIFSGNIEKTAAEEAKKIGADMFLAKEEHLPQDLVKILTNLFDQKHSPFGT